MIRWLINKRLDAVARDLGAPIDYVRHILRVSLRSFFKFAKVFPLAEHRRALPAEPHAVAGLVASRHEDCGTCVQIAVHQARKAGVRPEILRAVLASRPEDLPEDLADVYHFAHAVVNVSGEEDSYRERIRGRHGEEALVELALALAVSRVFPTTKRALGYAKSCASVPVEV